jgi:predicted Fe-Mo cluster-binding NifX family protein
MKIAIATDDGQTISAHFGRATHYLVFSVEGNQITGHELRAKAGHHQLQHEHTDTHTHHPHDHQAGHGMDAGAKSRHARMIAAITDCEAVLACGMGRGIYLDLQQAGIRPVLTTVANITEAVELHLAGRLDDHPERLH